MQYQDKTKPTSTLLLLNLTTSPLIASQKLVLVISNLWFNGGEFEKKVAKVRASKPRSSDINKRVAKARCVQLHLRSAFWNARTRKGVDQKSLMV